MSEIPLCPRCQDRPARPRKDGHWNLCGPCNTADHKDRRLRGTLAPGRHGTGGALGATVMSTPIVPETSVRPLAPIVKTTTKEMLARLDSIGVRLLDSITDEAIDKASLKDRMIAAGIAIEKRQLLSGQPTQILSIDERRSLNALVPALLREAQRRGIAPIESTAIDVTPAAP